MQFPSVGDFATTRMTERRHGLDSKTKMTTGFRLLFACRICQQNCSACPWTANFFMLSVWLPLTIRALSPKMPAHQGFSYVCRLTFRRGPRGRLNGSSKGFRLQGTRDEEPLLRGICLCLVPVALGGACWVRREVVLLSFCSWGRSRALCALPSPPISTLQKTEITSGVGLCLHPTRPTPMDRLLLSLARSRRCARSCRTRKAELLLSS